VPGTAKVPEPVSVTVHVVPPRTPGQLVAAAGVAGTKAVVRVDDRSARAPTTAAPRPFRRRLLVRPLTVRARALTHGICRRAFTVVASSWDRPLLYKSVLRAPTRAALTAYARKATLRVNITACGARYGTRLHNRSSAMVRSQPLVQ